jgi:3',5'-cyclic AMP phosphodiesterase CpdA
MCAGFDHLLISGAIVQEPRPENYIMARRLLSDLGLMNSERLTVVIGNHEIYGGVHLAKDILTFPAQCRATDYDRRVREFREYFPEAFAGTITVSPGDPFPFAKIIGDTAIIGVNSIARYSIMRNFLASRGKISSDEMGKLKSLLKNPLVESRTKIVMMHHHSCKNSYVKGPGKSVSGDLWRWIEWRSLKLRGSSKLIKTLRDGRVCAVLHGHAHENVSYERAGMRFVNGEARWTIKQGPS